MGPLGNVSVLIVEDEQEQRELYSTLLERSGATVLSAGSVQDAMRILGIVTPDVIITDIAMPGFTGLDLVERIRQKNGNQINVPIIAVTGYLLETDRKNLKLFGFQDLVPKPINPDTLVESIIRLTRKD